eukprot:TRINITY_DN1309_c0_g1_i1.p1 TRINITY_DN1309_c0_g1~~TRINITY_DN1309_c0_g1_i1.p1  ORF type:complete len:267 (+),score=68.45 TRINITY_DN1309_c0_g1_i1:65-802(+)
MSAVDLNLEPTYLFGLIPKFCWDTYYKNFQFFDQSCLKFVISHGLSLGIVVFSSILKLPQIITMIKKRSADNLSYIQFIVEIIQYCITIAYHYHNGYPFGVYGECVPLLIQTLLIVFLMLFYKNHFKKGLSYVIAINVVLVCSFLLFNVVGMNVLTMCQAIPFVIFSRLPPIIGILKSRNAGANSALVYMLTALGAFARIFTIMQSTKDLIVLSGFAASALLNTILTVEILIFKEKKMEDKEKTE